MKNVAVLLSGRGSNFIALAEAIKQKEILAEIVAVISNRSNSTGLNYARTKGYPTWLIPSRGKSREAFDQEVASRLKTTGTEIVCLAGFMRILSPLFVQMFPQRILNIHPSLLPSFPGLHAQRQAIEWGAKISGGTVHFVDEKLDHGPIILQQSVPIMDDDDENSLSERILDIEHKIYPEALRLICRNLIKIEGRKVLRLD